MKKNIRLVVPALLTISLSFAAAAAPRRADAQTAASVEEARQHYKRGVDLYGESNFTAALIEFRRAYEIAPNFSVLYNIGQIHFQLHDYAEALKTFQTYLQEGGARVPPARRAEVEHEVAYLRDRVGYVELTTNADGADVTVDGISVGHAPFTQPVIVTVGRRRIELVKNDRVLAVRQIEVAAGDHIKVELNEAPSNAPAASAGNPQGALAPGQSSMSGGGAEEPAQNRGPWPTIMWTSTGVLAAGTAVVGVLALGAASDLKTKRTTDGESRADLDSASSKTKTLALVTDVLGIATVLAAGTATYLTLTPRSSKSGVSEVQVRVGGGGVSLAGSF